MFIRLCGVAFALFLQMTPTPQRIDFNDDTSGTQRFDTLWLVTYIDGSGHEAIAQAPTNNGEIVPLLAADETRLKNIIEAGKAIARANGIKLHLVRFSRRADIDEFLP
jgi:hypothetical protein